MENALLWPAICLLVGLILILAEILIPSGGLLGLSACVFLGASLWLAFSKSWNLGFTYLGALAVSIPLMLCFAIYLWPRTPMGKWLSLRPPDREQVEPDFAVSQGTRLEYLLGQFGRTLTPLRPSGTVDVDGRRFDGIAEDGLIPAGSIVKIVQIRGGQVVVRIGSSHQLDELLADTEST